MVEVSGVAAIFEAPDTMTAVVRVRSNFATNHLKVAAQSARDGHLIEKENAHEPFGPWFDGMMRLVPVSVIMAGAALEANANEILQDILDSLTHFRPTTFQRALLQDLKADTSGNARDRYRRLALVMEKEPDTSAWENVQLLIKFRNDFMHFRPSWDDDDVHGGKFVERLKIKLPTVDAFKSNFRFPYGFMNYACAKWAVQTVLTFSAEFAALLAIDNRFAASHLDFTLP